LPDPFDLRQARNADLTQTESRNTQTACQRRQDADRIEKYADGIAKRSDAAALLTQTGRRQNQKPVAALSENKAFIVRYFPPLRPSEAVGCVCVITQI
jgi:hypothetical protein